MTPDQLRELADKFEQSEPPPWPGQSLPGYQLSAIAHRMARFLREMAAGQESDLLLASPPAEGFEPASLEEQGHSHHGPEQDQQGRPVGAGG